MAIQRYRKRPKPDDGDQLAARYQPVTPLRDLLTVARMASDDAELTEVRLPSGRRVLLVRWTSYPDDHPPQTNWQVVEPGQWLAYSGSGDGFLYDASEGDWRQFYELVEVT